MRILLLLFLFLGGAHMFHHQFGRFSRFYLLHHPIDIYIPLLCTINHLNFVLPQAAWFDIIQDIIDRPILLVILRLLLRMEVVFRLIVLAYNWKVINLEIYVDIVPILFKIQGVIFTSLATLPILLTKNMHHRRSKC